jgi:hypothetical protein
MMATAQGRQGTAVVGQGAAQAVGQGALPAAPAVVVGQQGALSAAQAQAAPRGAQAELSAEYMRAYQQAMQDALRTVAAEGARAAQAAPPAQAAPAQAAPARAAPAQAAPPPPPLVSASPLSSSPDVISAVCAVRDPSDGSYALARQVGLPAEVCDAWAGMGEMERDACVHTFRYSNTGELSMQMASMCAASLSEALGTTDRELMQCLRAEGGLPEGACTTQLRSALVLADNAPIGEAVKRAQARMAQKSTGDREALRQIRAISEKATPQQSDVYDMVALCRWDRGGSRDARANELLTEAFLALPAAERRLCNEGNADCEALNSVQDMCHSIQHKMGSNAFVAKVDEFYGRGGFTDAAQLLKGSMELYPEPYGSTFSEILIACESDKAQADVARALLSTDRGDVVRHRELCRRIDEGVSALPRMTGEMAAVAAMNAV